MKKTRIHIKAEVVQDSSYGDGAFEANVTLEVQDDNSLKLLYFEASPESQKRMHDAWWNS